ncbi:A1pp-domain-containing protein, partial [Exidia glandulosa HHB12029]
MERGELNRSLSTALAFLLAEATGHDYYDHIASTDTWYQLQVLRSLLCERHALPPLPADVMDAVDCLTLYQQAHRIQVSTASIPPRYCTTSSPRVQISLWRGDITTLTDVTAIVNAANEQLMGCFQPQHRCIDNVIHLAAGPRLRSACYKLMAAQDHRPEPNGHAKLTPGYALSAQWVLHTVGPQLHPGQEPSEREKDDLRSCYLSCLDAVEKLSPLPDGRLVIAFPCISTGLFCFPADLAARIAVAAVESWCASHPTTTLTDVIFDVFSDADEQHYEGALAEALN